MSWAWLIFVDIESQPSKISICSWESEQPLKAYPVLIALGADSEVQVIESVLNLAAYQGRQLVDVGKVYTASPGGCSERIHMFFDDAFYLGVKADIHGARL